MPRCVPICDDCGNFTLREWFMVHENVWAAARLPRIRGGVFCVCCLEQRLGRQLEPMDFSDAAVNKQEPLMTDRLLSRLGLVRQATSEVTGEPVVVPVLDLDMPTRLARSGGLRLSDGATSS